MATTCPRYSDPAVFIASLCGPLIEPYNHSQCAYSVDSFLPLSASQVPHLGDELGGSG